MKKAALLSSCNIYRKILQTIETTTLNLPCILVMSYMITFIDNVQIAINISKLYT